MSLPRSPQSLTRRPLSVQRRRDLRVVQTRHRNSSAIVVKDPIAMKYHRLQPEEYFIFEQLEPGATLESLREAFEVQFAPQRVTASDINSLLMRLHQNGLTISEAANQGERLNERQRKESLQKLKQALSSVLFIRFPGVDPEPLLRRLYPLVRPFLNRFGIALFSMLVASALMVFASRWTDFWAEFPRIQQWLTADSVLILAIVIGTTKICHELGHAIACKHFGGECHSIGPMLLVFTPALYCDTSDSWMLPNRVHRAVVGLAGMLTEILIASIAAIVWSNTSPGLAHVVSMNIMVVCGISTLLFNANPLLRYDGYYVLSDLVDVPNLGEVSKRLLSARVASTLFGVEDSQEDEFYSPSRMCLIAYAIAAEVYRISLTFLILWMLSLMLRPYRLESIGYVLCVFAFVGIVTSFTRAPIRFLKNPSRRRQLKMKRLMITSTVAVVLVALGCYPFASTTTHPGRVLPRVETPIYVSSAGQLVEFLHRPGDIVQKGDKIALLENKEIELEATKLRGRVATQEGVIASLKQSQVESPEAGNQLPTAIAMLDDLREQLRNRESRVDGLAIVAPASGMLIEPPKYPEPRDVELTLASWSGRATDSINTRCYLETGTELMTVTSANEWDLETSLEAADVQQIHVGSQARVLIDSLPNELILGKVVDISRSQWTLDQNHERRDDPQTTQASQPLVPKYVVRIQLQETDVPVITGAAATARTEAAPASFFTRSWRTLTSLIRFR